jgi:carboxypeptidase C (cathepsin A)
MNRHALAALVVVCVCGPIGAQEKTAPAQESRPDLAPMSVTSEGSVRTASGAVDYQSVLGTLVVHPQGWDDTAPADDKDNPTAVATMSYVAYFKKGAEAAKRPLTFLFNGGPGSSTVWLHMGAFGPKRVVTLDHSHTPAAPYKLVDNDQTLLDASDLVFVDAPGTGFGRIAGKDKEKAFYGVDQDIHAFAAFISDFLSKYKRWNSPKYVFGESYGTMRGAGLALALADESIDLNGVMLLSCILNWDTMPDDPELNPGIDEPYEVALPTYAATAWYHHKLPNQPKDLKPFLDEVQRFAITDYALALLQGNALTPDRRQAIAEKLHEYTSLPVAYLLKTNLRIEYGAFQKELLSAGEQTTGTLDTRFTGATLDPLSKISQYDPQSAAISAAYVGAFNAYVRQALNYSGDAPYKSEIDVYGSWDYKHQAPGAPRPLIALPNVLPDLAVAMKRNPDLKVMVAGGYFDVSTPYYEGWFELHHLPAPPSVQSNIEYHYYESGHMVYAHLPSLTALHDDVLAFVRKTSGS